MLPIYLSTWFGDHYMECPAVRTSTLPSMIVKSYHQNLGIPNDNTYMFEHLYQPVGL